MGLHPEKSILINCIILPLSLKTSSAVRRMFVPALLLFSPLLSSCCSSFSLLPLLFSLILQMSNNYNLCLVLHIEKQKKRSDKHIRDNKMLFSLYHYRFVALTCICCLRLRQRKKRKHTFSTHICTGSTHLITSLRQKYPSNQRAAHFPPHATHFSPTMHWIKVFFSQSFVETCLSAACSLLQEMSELVWEESKWAKMV